MRHELLAFRTLRIAEDEPGKSGLKAKASFSLEMEKRLSDAITARSRISCSLLPGESWHQHRGYMIPNRLPWRRRARPSATLHEIQVRSEERTCSDDATKFIIGRQEDHFLRGQWRSRLNSSSKSGRAFFWRRLGLPLDPLESWS